MWAEAGAKVCVSVWVCVWRRPCGRRGEATTVAEERLRGERREIWLASGASRRNNMVPDRF